jgi:ADP-ribosyl-[dinitrogen reductase] hydrolase
VAKFGKKPNKSNKPNKSVKFGHASRADGSDGSAMPEEANNASQVADSLNQNISNSAPSDASQKPIVDNSQIADNNLANLASETSNSSKPTNGKVRIYRNPSGRSARIAPDLRIASSDEPQNNNTILSSASAPVEVLSPSNTTPAAPPIEVTSTFTNLIDPEADFSVAHVTGSYRRERSIEGLLLGTSIGDALGLGRSGLSRSSSLRIMGRGPLDYCVIPSVGIVSSDTHRMLMTLQSILRSRSQMDLFRRNFAMRLRYYLLSIPVSAGRATILPAIRLWLGVAPAESGIDSDDNSPLVNALAMATVLQGTGHSIERWVAVSTEVTQVKPEVTQTAILIARAAYLAIMTDPKDFKRLSLLDRLIGITDDITLSKWLEELRRGLEEDLGTHAMAERLGWGDKIPKTAGPTAIMAIYAWMKHHDQFEKVVESAVLLGGDSVTLGALSGGLAGINLGAKKIPERLLSRLWSWPNNRKWLDTLTRRFTDWPHGSEDLHLAPAMPTRAGLQLVRSGILAASLTIGAAIKIPWKLSHWIVGS